MPHQDFQSVLQLQAKYAQDLQTEQNDFYVFRTTGDWTLANMTAVAEVYQAWEDATAKALRTVFVGLQELILTDLTSLAGKRLDLPVTPQITGTDGTGPLPNNVTVAIKADTGVRGRGVNGRIFWIGLAHDMVSASELTTGAGTSIVDALELLQSNIEALEGGSILHMCIIHHVIGGVRPPIGTHTNLVGWSISDYELDSQRDRLPGHKRHRKPRAP